MHNKEKDQKKKEEEKRYYFPGICHGSLFFLSELNKLRHIPNKSIKITQILLRMWSVFCFMLFSQAIIYAIK